MEAADHPPRGRHPGRRAPSLVRELLALPVEVTYRFAEVVRLLPTGDRPVRLPRARLLRLRALEPAAAGRGLRPVARGRGSSESSGSSRSSGPRLGGEQPRRRAAGERSSAARPRRSSPGRPSSCSRSGWTSGTRSCRASRSWPSTRRRSATSRCRTARMAPLDERLRDQTTIELEHEDGDWFRIVRGGDEVELEEECVPEPAADAGDRRGRAGGAVFTDYPYRDRPYGRRKDRRSRVAGVARGRTRRPATDPIRVRLELQAVVGVRRRRRRAHRYRLDERFTDYLTERVIEELRAIDAEPRRAFVGCSRTRARRAPSSPVPTAIRAKALELARRHGMTASQLEALRAGASTGRRACLGPAGHRQDPLPRARDPVPGRGPPAAGPPYSVLVTAFTHAAIDNCLRKVVELQADRGVVAGELAIGKLGRSSSAGMGASRSSRAEQGRLPGSRPPVAVARRHGLGHAARASPAGRADLVVIDEGSQLKVAGVRHRVRRLRAGGRLLVAGDHLQLPPIVQGAYPEPARASRCSTARSSRPSARRDADERPVMVTLLENFRMNGTLCRYPADRSTTRDTTAPTTRSRDRRLALDGTGAGDLADLHRRPRLPARGRRTSTASGRPPRTSVEAGLVADVAVRAPRAPAAATDGTRRTRDDRRVLDGRPVHRQPAPRPDPRHPPGARRRAARGRRAPFVGTVDKMQGQECDAVIVELRRRRRRVRAERAGVHLLAQPPERVDHPRPREDDRVPVPRPARAADPGVRGRRIADGIAFMQGLAQFARRHGESFSVELPDQARLTLHRLPAG